jgi:hypothetical protein
VSNSVQTPLGHQPRDIGRRLAILFICEQFGTVPAPAATQHYREETESLPRSPFFDLMRAWRKKDERLYIRPGFQFPWGSAAGRDTRKQNQHAVTAELLAARTRETAWLREKSDLLQRKTC